MQFNDRCGQALYIGHCSEKKLVVTFVIFFLQSCKVQIEECYATFYKAQLMVLNFDARAWISWSLAIGWTCELLSLLHASKGLQMGVTSEGGIVPSKVVEL